MTANNAAFPATLIVGDGGYPAIQDAIDASVDGDEIIVEPGVYYENIEFLGKDIILRSIDPLDQDVVTSTVIDGQGLLPVVTFDGTEGTTCVLSGFTIRNGLGHEFIFDRGNEVIIEYWGGAIQGNVTEAQVDHCRFRENRAHSGMTAWLGGSFLYNDIKDNINLEHNGSEPFSADSDMRTCFGDIAYNKIENAYQGSGIYNSAPYIHHNYITRCNGGIGGYGIVDHNLVVDNGSGGIGGIQDYYEISAEIFNNVVIGSGLRGIASSDVPIYNNIICFNNLDGILQYGGGIDGCDGPIYHNIVAFNHASIYGGGDVFL